MNRINQLFNSNKKDLLSIYFCAGDPTLDGTADVIRTLEKHGVSMIEVGIPFSDPMGRRYCHSKCRNSSITQWNVPKGTF